MKKYVLDLTVTENIRLHANYVLIKLTQSDPLPEMLPGQFAEIRVDGSPTTFLRRPISINYVDRKTNEVWFLVQLVGDGTRKLATVQKGDTVNVVLPLGNGFSMPESPEKKVHTTTEDGSMGEKGYVTMHSVLANNQFDMIYTCGPKPMMMAVAKYAKAHNIECEVSLENTMACGVGACLCCVEKTDEGHVCVCKEGPVFNIKKLLWQI